MANIRMFVNLYIKRFIKTLFACVVKHFKNIIEMKRWTDLDKNVDLCHLDESGYKHWVQSKRHRLWFSTKTV